jgi:hypothetical protein
MGVEGQHGVVQYVPVVIVAAVTGIVGGLASRRRQLRAGTYPDTRGTYLLVLFLVACGVAFLIADGSPGLLVVSAALSAFALVRKRRADSARRR